MTDTDLSILRQRAVLYADDGEGTSALQTLARSTVDAVDEALRWKAFCRRLSASLGGLEAASALAAEVRRALG